VKKTEAYTTTNRIKLTAYGRRKILIDKLFKLTSISPANVVIVSHHCNIA